LWGIKLDKIEKLVEGAVISALIFLIVGILIGFYDLPITARKSIWAILVPVIGGFIRISIKA
jgi:hypothetical protein